MPVLFPDHMALIKSANAIKLRTVKVISILSTIIPLCLISREITLNIEKEKETEQRTSLQLPVFVHNTS